MKKNYIFLFVLSFGFVSSTFSQDRRSLPIGAPDDEIETAIDVVYPSDLSKKKTVNPKLFGDTLAFYDFNGGLPTNWTIINNNANNFIWEWNTVYQQGQFSTTRNAIKSTSAANGFMSLPSDFYNTPTPSTGRVNMDTYFQSDTITITPKSSVWVSYQQYLRYCCNASNRLALQVSTDNFINFVEYDAKDGLAVNVGNTTDAVGGQTNLINISTAVAGQSQFQIRFLANGNGRYFWMIDDVAIIEGVDNDLELRDPYMEFNELNYTYYPFYARIPYDLFPPLPFFGRIYNNGSNTATNVRLEADVTNTAGPGGTSGTGLVYSSSSPSSSLLSGTVRDTADDFLTSFPRFVPNVLGDFQVDILATSDSTDNNINNEDATLFFSISDSIFARDDNVLSGGTGPASYVRNGQSGGTTVGDRFGMMYIVESRTGNGVHNIPTSVTFFVSEDIRNIGVEIVPKIWAFNGDSLFVNGANFDVDRAFGNEVASSFIPYTVNIGDTNTLLTLPFDNGSALINGCDSGQYVVGWEVTSIAGGTTFEVRNDASTSALQSAVTTFNYHGHSPGWGWVRANPAIRLNFGNKMPVGLNSTQESSLKFEVSPNPSNGLFTLNLASDKPATYNMIIRNAIGQSVYQDAIAVNGETTQQIDLTKLEKGVYLIHLENNIERFSKKVIVK